MNGPSFEGLDEPRRGFLFEPRWLLVSEVLALHARQIQRFGGPTETRDLAVPESALDRQRNKWSFGERDLAVLAGAYAFGIPRNHPFVDGNKRAAFHTAVTFLRVNEVRFKPPMSEATARTLALAAGTIGESDFVAWVRDRWPAWDVNS
jgi:death on curing protein